MRAARLIDDEAVSGDTRLDVVAGAAGAILALLALDEVRHEPWLLERARLCGEHLLSRRHEPGPGLVSWPLPAGAGFAHGTAGVAYALARLSRVTRDRAFLDAATRAYAYERTLFSARHANWPILGRGVTTADTGSTTMTAWCHGAPGIGLARALAHDTLFDARVAEEIDVAMSTTSACATSRSDHLCCGNLGRADVLLAVGRTLDRPELVKTAEGIAERVTVRARERGHFGLPASAFEYRVFTPGFFKGLSGIGYQLLRIAEPDRFPSILGFEVPRPC